MPWSSKVMAIVGSPDGFTVRTAVLEVMPLRLAVMLLVPAAAAVARPPLAIVATPVLLEAHVTLAVMFAVELSL